MPDTLLNTGRPVVDFRVWRVERRVRDWRGGQQHIFWGLEVVRLEDGDSDGDVVIL